MEEDEAPFGVWWRAFCPIQQNSCGKCRLNEKGKHKEGKQGYGLQIGWGITREEVEKAICKHIEGPAHNLPKEDAQQLASNAYDDAVASVNGQGRTVLKYKFGSQEEVDKWLNTNDPGRIASADCAGTGTASTTAMAGVAGAAPSFSEQMALVAEQLALLMPKHKPPPPPGPPPRCRREADEVDEVDEGQLRERLQTCLRSPLAVAIEIDNKARALECPYCVKKKTFVDVWAKQQHLDAMAGVKGHPKRSSEGGHDASGGVHLA